MQSALGTGHLVAGRYRLLDQLGRGAMGIVWRGRDELLDRDVAIKQIVLGPMASATEARASYERTLREARTAARLSHPGVVTVFDVVEEDGSPWIVMELVRARPLDQVIAEDGPLPPARAAQLGLGLLEALTSAHEAGVLHRDVKPSNVLISPDGKAVLTDFGIAMIQGDPGLTQAGMVVGTPGFSPPERVRGGQATRASDLWSLGATLYAAVEGRGPFDRAGGSAAIVASIATEPAPRAPSAGPLAPVIDALLKADPAERPDGPTTARMLTQAWKAARTAGRVGIQASQLPVQNIPVQNIPGPASPGLGSPGLGSPGPGSPGQRSRGQQSLVRESPAHDGQAQNGQAQNSPVQNGPAGHSGKASASPANAGSDATTATQVVSVPDASPVGAARLGESASAGADAGDGVSLAGAVAAAASAAAAFSVVPDLMATPNFADLTMPAGTTPSDQALHPGIEPAATLDPGDIGTDPLVAAESGADGRKDPAPALPGRPGDPGGGAGRARTASEFLKKRWVVVLAPIAALAVAGGIVYATLPGVHTPLSRLGGGNEPGGQGPIAAGRGGHHEKGAGRQGGHSSGNRPGSGGSGPSGKATPGQPSSSGKPKPTGKPSASGKPSSGKPSSSPSSSTSPTPSPDPSPSASSPSPGGGTPPAGYVWDRVTAASVGTIIAGFRIAGPAAWVMTPGLNTVIKPVKAPMRLVINMATWVVTGPVREAKRQQAIAKAHDPGYQLISIVATKFHGWPGARWTYWWQPVTAVNPTEVVELLFTAQTYEGPQQYTMRMSAPLPRVASALKRFHVAMRTFKALPF